MSVVVGGGRRNGTFVYTVSTATVYFTVLPPKTNAQTHKTTESHEQIYTTIRVTAIHDAILQGNYHSVCLLTYSVTVTVSA